MADLIHQQVGSNIMDGGIAELGHAQQIASKMVSNHSNSSHRRNKAKVVAHPIVSEKLPLDEAAKLEIKSLPNKTPVSVLQELLSRRGTTPNYELVQIEGAIHEPTFRYRVTVADVVAMGTGRSKKEAKHTAAKAILDKLIGANENSDASIINSIIENQNSLEHQSGDEKVANNPIGSLQEMCMTHHWPPPKYTMEGEEGLPHERQFTIICNILKYRQVGLGKSKKLAKRQAAFKMWQSLQDQNIVRSEGAEDDEIVQRNTNPRDHYAGLKDSKIATLTSLHSNKVSQFHKNLKSSTGVKLFELQSTCLNDGDVNLVQFLQEIASEQQFEVTYVDIEEKSISGKYQCLVQLSTLPVAVCYGSGTTSKDAQAAAAQNALEYLKIMTKKNKNFKPTTKVDQSQYKQNSNDKKFKVSVNNMADVQNVSSTVTKDSIEIKIKHYHSSTVESIKSNNDVYTNSSKGKKFKKKKVKEYTSKPTAAITQPNSYYHCDKKKTCKMPIYSATSYQNSMFDMGHSTIFQQNNLKVDENIVNDGAKIKPNVVNLQCINNISANYTGFSEACQQPAITNMLFPEASSSYSATQLNQLNHFQNCAPNNYHSSSRIDAILPQYENSAYVQSYSATDLPNNQYQFQRASSTSIQDGSLFIQNLQNQLPVTDFFDSNFT